MTLADKVLEYPDLADWQVADVLNAPDPTLDEVVEVNTTMIGIGSILVALGPEDGAAFLDVVEASAQQNAVIRWALYCLKQGALDVGLPVVRAQIAGLADLGILTGAQVDSILALAETRRHPSWSEKYGITVNAREVGLARGAKP